MKKFLAGILATVITMFSSVTLTSCAELTEILDLSFENECLIQENAELKDQIEELEATLNFYTTFNGIVGEDNILELSKVKLEVGNKSGDALIIEDSAQVTINGGYFDGGITPLDGLGNTAVCVRSADAKVVINAGTFIIDGLAEGATGHIDLIYCTQGTIEINGGWFEGTDDTVWLVNCKDEYYNDGTANIIVKGGSFVNFDPSNCLTEDVTDDAGVRVPVSYVAKGYKVVSQVYNEGQVTEYTVYTVVAEEVAE